MRIVRWTEPGAHDPRFGLWIDDMIADAGTPEEAGLPPGSGLEGLFAGGTNALLELESRAVTRTRRPRAEVRLLAPLVRPSKILAVGLNYRAHAEEQGKEAPAKPRLFLKPSTAIIGPEDEIVIPSFCRHADPEVELAIVIGKRAKNVQRARAGSHIAGYTIVNDFTDRKAQKDDVQYSRAKGFDTFCPMGPAIVTKDEVPNPGGLPIRLSVDGEVRQEANTSDLIHDVKDLVAYASQGMTLEPGDVISTGTPPGVGVFRDPQVFITAGQTIRCEIEGIGILENRVVGETT
ncbi:MAG: 2-hydroxyhepta-2,4-diene-1,7-dioate isomerase [Gemmatimonadota bacterium]|nr:MAG: 2-hydroxyhepta-2,4-diene-1,7-dioate isomerase [Gemmatimonadota bacterium]